MQRYIGVSTKMYLGYRDSIEWLKQIRRVIEERPGLHTNDLVQPFIVPSFPLLEQARNIFEGSCVWIGAQNSSWSNGALTGEVSPALLAELGIRLVEVGHAERRRIFHEDDQMIQDKVSAILAAELTPLLCIGEPTRTNHDIAAQYCGAQITAALGSSKALSSVIVAYEPVWAIGMERPAEPSYINGVIGRLRRFLAVEHSVKDVRIVYGGSASTGLLRRLDAVDGLFLGRFAHDPYNFGRVLDEALVQVMPSQL